MRRETVGELVVMAIFGLAMLVLGAVLQELRDHRETWEARMDAQDAVSLAVQEQQTTTKALGQLTECLAILHTPEAMRGAVRPPR